MHMTQGLHRAVQATPGRTATINGARTRTFGEQADRVARLASALRGLGVAIGDRVGILALNSDRYTEYLLAVPWAGAVINPLNIRWNINEIIYALNDSGTRCLFVDDAFAGVAGTLRQSCPDLEWLVFCGDDVTPDGMESYEELLSSYSPMADERRSGDDLAGLFYTGGTTGFPKGVMLSHRNLVTSALGTVATGQLLAPDAVLLHAAPMFHLADLAAWMGQVLLGGTHVTVPMFKTDEVLRAVQDHAATDMVLVPTMIQMLVDDSQLAEYDLTSLRRILYGGSSISEGLLTRVMSRLPQVKLTQAYGMTEAAPVATVLYPADHHGPRMASAGRAAPHAEIQVVDESFGALSSGQVGEICVRGDHVMQGYWGLPAETEEVFAGGWYRTGDAGYVDEDGFLYVVDRFKDMIVTGAENVYCAEVENALSTHPHVAACAVIGLPSDQWGETVHAYVVAVPGVDPSAEDLQDHVRARLANYKVPRSIEFLDELPVSGAGKVLKRQLRQRSNVTKP